ncbi:MAG TPA: ABC transporter permease [Lacunisphaera sp.]|jgi:predicted permease
MKSFRKLRSLFRRQKLDAEMTEEMRTHLDLQTAQHIAAGMNPDEARYLAQRQFGNVASIQERAREGRDWIWLAQIAQDLRYTVRSLRRSPGFSVAAILIFALGIGVSTAMFSVVHGVLLDPYPYAKSKEIWAPVVADLKSGQWMGLQVRDYLELSRLSCVSSAMTTAVGRGIKISGDPFPDVTNAVRVSGTAFQFLDVPPVLGRGIAPSDILPNGEAQPVTVLSFQFWQQRFNGDPSVIGRTIVLNDVPHAIIGIMPPRFGWYGSDSLWLPLPTTDLGVGANPILRLKPGISRETAEQQLRALYIRLVKEMPDRFPKAGFSTRLENYLDITSASGAMRTTLMLLVFAVGFLLLIACTNVANLQLARSAGRAREIAVRLAIGASRGRLIRQLLTESILLSLVAGVLGCLLSLVLIKIIVVLMPPFYVPNEARVMVNGLVLAFAFGLSTVTGVLAGLAPGLQCTRPNLNYALKEGGQGAASGERSVRTRNSLVVTAVALSVILLVGASLAIRGFAALYRHDWGFRPAGLLVLRVPLPPARYVTLGQRSTFARDLIERIKNLPGVTFAAFGSLPFNSSGSSGYQISGQPKTEGVAMSESLVSADFRATFGLTLRQGRDLTEREVTHGDAVALISEATAKLWPVGESPLGRTIELDALADASRPDNLAPVGAAKEVTVVGIVGDTLNANFRAAPPPAIYVPYTLRGLAMQQLLVRTNGAPLSLLPSIRSELRAMDKDLPLYRPITVEEIMGQQTAQPRFNMTLFGGLAIIALVLAAAGIYCVLSFSVAQRTREIGVRMALGAEHGDIQHLILRAGGRLLAIGLSNGLVISLGLMKLLQKWVPNNPMPDAFDVGAVVLTLVVAALLACWLPARRATKVNPMVALRAE